MLLIKMCAPYVHCSGILAATSSQPKNLGKQGKLPAKKIQLPLMDAWIYVFPSATTMAMKSLDFWM